MYILVWLLIGFISGIFLEKYHKKTEITVGNITDILSLSFMGPFVLAFLLLKFIDKNRNKVIFRKGEK